VAKSFQGDVASQRALGLLLQTSRDRAALAAAKAAWQKIESLTTAGSTAWLSARLNGIEATLLLGDRAEAAKLLKLTQLLYPNPESPEMQQRMSELERQLTP
jgi:hypothetical protein